MEVQVEQVQKAYGGPQAMWILTYLWIKATPEAINQHSLPFNLNLALFYS
jgi:hypothetical protein